MRRPHLAGLAAGAGLVSGLVAVWGPEVDLDVYRYGAATVLDGRELYASRDGLPFTYPPFAALAFLALLVGPAALVSVLWTALSVAALGVTVALVTGHRRLGALLLPTTVALAFEPVHRTLSFGQVNLVLMALIAYDLLRPDRRAAGWLLGVAAGVKLTPLIFVALLVLVGRRRQAGVAAGAFAATVALGAVLLPADSWAFWTSAMWQPDRVGSPHYAGNQSAYGVLSRLVEEPRLLWLLVAGVLAGVMLLTAAALWRSGRAATAVCLTGLAMVTASPISWTHHWVWAVPLALLVWERSRRVAVAWSAGFVLWVVWWPPYGSDREVGWGAVEQLLGGAYLAAAVALTGWLMRTLPSGTPAVGRGDEASVAGPASAPAR